MNLNKSEIMLDWKIAGTASFARGFSIRKLDYF